MVKAVSTVLKNCADRSTSEKYREENTDEMRLHTGSSMSFSKAKHRKGNNGNPWTQIDEEEYLRQTGSLDED